MTSGGVMLLTQPKSASTFIYQRLCDANSQSPMRVEAGEWPIQKVLLNQFLVHDAAATAKIMATNAFPTREYAVILEGLVGKLILHVREPRQLILSWIHQLDKMVMPNAFARTLIGYPEGYWPGALQSKIDFYIEQTLPVACDWLCGWNSWFRTRLSQFPEKFWLSRFEDLVTDPRGYADALEEFLGWPKGKSHVAQRPSEGDLNLRLGKTDEWREVFDEAQIARCQKIIPPMLFEAFGWAP